MVKRESGFRNFVSPGVVQIVLTLVTTVPSRCLGGGLRKWVGAGAADRGKKDER